MVFKRNKSEKVVISVRMDAELLERIDKMAGEKDLSRNEIICQGIAFALDEEQNSTST